MPGLSPDFLLFCDKAARSATRRAAGCVVAKGSMGARTTEGVIGRVAGFVLAPCRLLCAAGLALLTGCSGMSDVSVESVLVVPGK